MQASAENSSPKKLSLSPDRNTIMMRYKTATGRLHARGHIQTFLLRLVTFGLLLGGWHALSLYYAHDLILPSPIKVGASFIYALQDPEIMANLFLTLQRVLSGFALALLIGGSLGLLMANSKIAMQLIDPILNPLRQIPVMAWVPLAIIWFGLGEGPTIFLITLVAIFPILLCTVSGVQGIDKDYYNAARTLGASRLSLFRKITVPAAMPELLTGMRAGVSAGWMSVI